MAGDQTKVTSARHGRLIDGAKAAPFPGFIEPCCPTPRKERHQATEGWCVIAQGVASRFAQVWPAFCYVGFSEPFIPFRYQPPPVSPPLSVR